MSVTRRSFASLVGCITAISGENRSRFEECVQSYEASGTFMGNVLLARGSQVLFQRSSGYANLEWNVRNVRDGKFRIGSMSKQFTATCVLLLVADGTLDLDTSVTRYLPNPPDSWKSITLHHLLTHTSGIPNLTSLPGFGKTKSAPSTLYETMLRFRDLPLDFVPGTDGKYSNSGYVVLANVIEAVSKQSFIEFLNARVLTALHLTNTGSDMWRPILKARVSGYTHFQAGIGNADYIDMSVPLGAGSLYSTVDDLHHWMMSLHRGKLIRADLRQRMLTPTRHNYGYGLEIRSEEGGRIIGHGGGIEGFNSFAQLREKDDLVAVVLSNLNTDITGKLANQLAIAARET